MKMGMVALMLTCVTFGCHVQQGSARPSGSEGMCALSPQPKAKRKPLQIWGVSDTTKVCYLRTWYNGVPLVLEKDGVLWAGDSNEEDDILVGQQLILARRNSSGQFAGVCQPTVETVKDGFVVPSTLGKILYTRVITNPHLYKPVLLPADE